MMENPTDFFVTLLRLLALAFMTLVVLAALLTFAALAGCTHTVTETRTVPIKPSWALLQPNRVEAPAGLADDTMRIGEGSLLIPRLAAALRACNADKAAIRTWYLRQDGDEQ